MESDEPGALSKIREAIQQTRNADRKGYLARYVDRKIVRKIGNRNARRTDEARPISSTHFPGNNARCTLGDARQDVADEAPSQDKRLCCLRNDSQPQRA